MSEAARAMADPRFSQSYNGSFTQFQTKCQITQLNNIGRIFADEWLQTAVIQWGAELDEWVVMPNHFHGVGSIARENDQPLQIDPIPRPKND